MNSHRDVPSLSARLHRVEAVLEIAPKGGEAHQEMAGEGGPPGAKLAPLRHAAPSSRGSLTRWATICLVAAVLAFSGCLGGGEGGGTEISDV
jgi:hypothetical protein